jgi:glycine cleavage system H protein
MSKKYSTDHVWIAPHGDGTATVGITVHAQDELGDVVFVDLPAIGAQFAKGAVAGVVESVKAAADVYTPAGGTVLEVNEALRAEPALANSDPLESGWMFKLRLGDATELEALMDEAAYSAFSG